MPGLLEHEDATGHVIYYPFHARHQAVTLDRGAGLDSPMTISKVLHAELCPSDHEDNSQKPK